MSAPVGVRGTPHRRTPRTVLGRGFAVLHCLADRGPQALADIAVQTGLPRPTAYRLLRSLAAEGLVVYDRGERTYRLGPALMALGEQARVQLPLVQSARPVLAATARQVREAVNLGVLVQTRVWIADTVYEPDGHRLTVRPTVTAELHCSALGKAILAALPEARARRLLAQLTLRPRTPNTITDPARLLAELEAARAHGVAYDDEESELGLSCVGAAVRNQHGFPIAAVSVSGPTSRMGSPHRERVEAAVRAAVERLGRMFASYDEIVPALER